MVQGHLMPDAITMATLPSQGRSILAQVVQKREGLCRAGAHTLPSPTQAAAAARGA